MHQRHSGMDVVELPQTHPGQVGISVVCDCSSPAFCWQQPVPAGRVGHLNCVRNLGAYFDASMSMSTHISHVISFSFYQLWCIRAIRMSIPTSTAVQLVNSLLAGLPACQLHRVQAISNSTARLVYGRRNKVHVTPLLRDKLHWLCIRERVLFTGVQGTKRRCTVLHRQLLF